MWPSFTDELFGFTMKMLVWKVVRWSEPSSPLLLLLHRFVKLHHPRGGRLEAAFCLSLTIWALVGNF